MTLAAALALGLASLLAAHEPWPLEGHANAASQRLAEAEANQSRVRTNASVIWGDQPHAAQEARALGHNGRVVIRGIILPSGEVVDALVLVSSGSSLLDAAALSAFEAALWTAAMDAGGAPLSVPVHSTFEFDGRYAGPEPGGLVRYRCAEFVQDIDWWMAAIPGRELAQHRLYHVVSDALLSGSMGMMAPHQRAAAAQGMDRAFTQALAACRAAPTRLMIETFPAPAAQELRRVGAER
jgi:TonB family protein